MPLTDPLDDPDPEADAELPEVACEVEPAAPPLVLVAVTSSDDTEPDADKVSVSVLTSVPVPDVTIITLAVEEPGKGNRPDDSLIVADVDVDGVGEVPGPKLKGASLFVDDADEEVTTMVVVGASVAGAALVMVLKRRVKANVSGSCRVIKVTGLMVGSPAVVILFLIVE